MLDFVACRVTSEIIGIGATKCSWGDINTIKCGKYWLSAVIYQTKRALFIRLPVFNQLGLDGLITNKTSMIAIPDMFVMMTMRYLLKT